MEVRRTVDGPPMFNSTMAGNQRLNGHALVLSSTQGLTCGAKTDTSSLSSENIIVFQKIYLFVELTVARRRAPAATCTPRIEERASWAIDI